MLTILKIPLFLFKAVIILVRFIIACLIFAVDHVIGVAAGAILGLGKGLSGLFGMGLRSLGVGLLKKL